MVKFKALSVAAFGAVMAFAAAASASILPPSVVSGTAGSTTILTPLHVGDVAPVVGVMGPGAFSQTIGFSVAPPGGQGGIQALNFSFLGLTDIMGLSYNLDGGAPVSAPNLLLSAFSPGDHVIGVAGTATGKIGGNYELKVGLTPIPGAVLLMGSALAGLGAVGYRRRQAA